MSLRNLDAEQSVLGAVLFDNRVLEQLAGLEAAHFSEPIHALVFEQAATLIRRGQRADAVSMRAWGEKAISLEIGGALYLADLYQRGALNGLYACDYAQELRGLAAARAVSQACLTADASLKGEADTLDVLAELERAIGAAKEGKDEIGDDAEAAGVAFLSGLDRPSISTGFPSLDKRLGGLHRGDLTILAGRPSMGKTAFAAQIARNIARRGGGVHFASLEMSKEQVARRFLSAATFGESSALDRIPYSYLRHGATFDHQRLRTLLARMPKSLIIDDRAALTVAQIEAGARATRRRVGHLELIVVDYLQLCRSNRTDGRVNEITEISQGLKAVAKRLNAPLMALCQLNRSVESRENKRPALADARDSGAIEQDADVFMAVFREAYYLERAEDKNASDEEEFRRQSKLAAVQRDMEILTLKQRQGPTGTDVLEAWLEYDTIIEKQGRAS